MKAAYLDSEPFATQIKKETDGWEQVIKTLGIKAD
jgi:tripartite-type tricarboxylate transporter receptor subunit TctC